MTDPRRTWLLLLALALAVGLDVGVRALTGLADAPLPPWPGFPAEAPVAVTLTRSEVVIRLEREGEGWAVRQPFVDEADDAAVEALLAAVGQPNLLDARIDADPEAFATYGLSGIDPIRVEVRGPDGVLADVYVGQDGPGRTTFVRLPGADDVYRARLGGRAVADRPPGTWRDPTLLDRAPEDVLGLTVRGAVDVAFARTSGLDGRGGWALEGRPDLPLDEPSVESIVAAFATLQAQEVLAEAPAELARPDLVVDVLLADGAETFRFVGLRGQVFGLRERDGRPFRVRSDLLLSLSRPVDAWRDRTLLRLDPSRLTEVSLDEGGRTTVLSREATGWVVARPLGVEVDPELAAKAIRFLASLTVDGWAAGPPPEGTFNLPSRVTLRGDGDRVLEVGAAVPGQPPGREAVYVRLAGAPEQVGAIPARTWSALRRAWAR